MRVHKITIGGQMSIPANIRRRWGTTRVVLDDLGDRLVVKPIPEDPVAAARGALKHRLRPSTDLRAVARADEARAERRRR